MTYFFDRCFPVRLAQALRILHGTDAKSTIQLVHFNDRPEFLQNTPDVEWIKSVSQWHPKPIVISADCAILKKPDEIRELERANLIFVCLAKQWPEMSIWDQAWRFIKMWPQITAQVEGLKRPEMFSLSGGHTPKLEKL